MDQFDVIRGITMVREVNMDWDEFISVVLYSSSSMLPKRSLRVRPVCPMYCEERVVSYFKHRLQLIMQIKLSEEQERF